ncbi:holo-ACP synthase [Sporanaerobium hydrogeniformans]|uniref:Holo-ACP synthase n=1 Tax=Sporanaerobium hydrogeniformans TaxID=3072179 RepID=A0AC61D9Q6_9FIRM|nr:holo-ACP synthase [Sporanaerobium hydrogeniformans]PHV69813.1 holo-ACP synthase [Sporanaerobium hydrogeniformans]
MIIGIGTDIIEIARIQKVAQGTTSFLNKAFTEKEQAYFFKKQYKAETIAGIFAAKEAISKAFGTGFRTFSLIDIEILPNTLGKPTATVYNNAKELLQELGAKEIQVSISHCKEYAVAYALIERSE